MNDEPENEYQLGFMDFVQKYVGISESNEYVIFSYQEDDTVLVVDRGDLDFCFERMKDIFELAPVAGGLAMMSKERFEMTVGKV